VVFADLNLLVERGDRVALVGPNGAGKSTLMRMLSGTEAPDRGTRTEGHQVVTEYFAQDEATRLDPRLTVYETLEAGSPTDMVPAIRTILGGFLFSGDDIYKKVSVLSGGERTRLAVARMLLRPSNTLLLDEPTNHLDLDSKDVLLDALEDYGGTLILVSHDRYFVERLATRIVEVGHGDAVSYPGTYPEFLWHKEHGAAAAAPKPKAGAAPPPAAKTAPRRPAATAGAPKPKAKGGAVPASPKAKAEREAQKEADGERRRRQKAADALRRRVAELEGRIAEREAEIRQLEAEMAAPGFYDDHAAAQPVVDRHQTLMWEVGDLMGQWEALQEHAAEQAPGS